MSVSKSKFFGSTYETKFGNIRFVENLIIDTMMESEWMPNKFNNRNKIHLLSFVFHGSISTPDRVSIDYCYCDTYQEALDIMGDDSRDFKRTMVDIKDYIEQKSISRKRKIKNIIKNK